ncbi:MAG: DUF6141 family protein [candidate division KSB1 bacterium]|nr:DUF6141 family protein [candidate division KSB1 bacterium]MDZ7364411.1 DUF6141 family protein [candidate division KSB1 bacterium]MDZ7402783.1 DUF6141 family protein [candidate division KSB1 bacterium]
MNSVVFFEEEQYFRQTWLWMALLPMSLLLLVVFGFGLYQQLYLGKPFGNKPMSNEGLVIAASVAALCGIGLPFLFYLMKLTVRVDSQYLHISFLPWRQKRIPLSDVVRWEACAYHPLRDFGGWGIRYAGKKKGWAYNVSGNQGVQLELNTGKRLLIGSQRPRELAEAIKRAKGI